MAALWATIVAYVLGIPARYYAYAALALGIFVVGCHCGRGFGISPQTADPNVVLVEHADPCPVNGSNCTCGCLSGGQCNCALTHVADERLSRLDPQALAYRDLCEWAEKHPGHTAYVYVQQDPIRGGDYDSFARCRYDAGWPQVKTPTVIKAVYRDGEFWEIGKFSVDKDGVIIPPVVQYRPVFQPFGGNCAGGRCH